MKKIVFGLVLCLLVTSCGQDAKYPKELIGTWYLDSVSGSSNKELDRIDFYVTDHYYEEIIGNGDVFQNPKGRYFINDNPKRGFKTLLLIPDSVRIGGEDAIYQNYNCFDILKLTADSLVVQEPTNWITRVDGITKRIDKKLFFKKYKNDAVKLIKPPQVVENDSTRTVD